MSTLHEGIHPGEFMVSEANGTRSRENITLTQTPTAVPGAIIGPTAVPDVWITFDSGLAVSVGGVLVTDGVPTGLIPADIPAVAIVRDAEVNEDELDWGVLIPADIVIARAALLAAGIIIRPAV